MRAGQHIRAKSSCYGHASQLQGHPPATDYADERKLAASTTTPAANWRRRALDEIGL